MAATVAQLLQMVQQQPQWQQHWQQQQQQQEQPAERSASEKQQLNARGFENIEVFGGGGKVSTAVSGMYSNLADVMEPREAHEGCGAQAILDAEVAFVDVDQAN